MTLHQLRAFLKVAEVQSFTQAAKALHLTQPAVSALVQDLVAELGYKLFERRGMKILLTQEGTALLRRAQEALAIIDGTQDEINELHGLKKGKLRVGGSVLAATSFLTVATQIFKMEHPGIEVIMKIERSDALEKELVAGELDVAILGLPAFSPLLASRPYREEEIVVIAPPRHPLAKKRSITLEMLSKEPLITYERGLILRDVIEPKFAARGLPFVPSLQVSLEFAGRDTIRSAVASGLGISFVSKCHVVGDIEAGRLKVLNVPELKLKRTMHIAWHKKREISPLAQSFIAFLKKYERKK